MFAIDFFSRIRHNNTRKDDAYGMAENSKEIPAYPGAIFIT